MASRVDLNPPAAGAKLDPYEQYVATLSLGARRREQHLYELQEQTRAMWTDLGVKPEGVRKLVDVAIEADHERFYADVRAGTADLADYSGDEIRGILFTAYQCEARSDDDWTFVPSERLVEHGISRRSFYRMVRDEQLSLREVSREDRRLQRRGESSPRQCAPRPRERSTARRRRRVHGRATARRGPPRRPADPDEPDLPELARLAGLLSFPYLRKEAGR